MGTIMSGIPDEQGRRLAIVPDRQATTGTFGTQAASFGTITPPDGAAGAGRDRPGADGPLTGVVEAIAGLHAQMDLFAAARPRDPVTARALAAVIGQAVSIVDDLAAELAAIRRALEQEAYTASRYGVKIGTDGQPPPVLTGPPADLAAASEQYWARVYQQAFEQAMAEVRQARQRAASQLMDLSATIEPPGRRSPGALDGTATGA
jgi:hypothetical protein